MRGKSLGVGGETDVWHVSKAVVMLTVVYQPRTHDRSLLCRRGKDAFLKTRRLRLRVLRRNSAVYQTSRGWRLFLSSCLHHLLTTGLIRHGYGDKTKVRVRRRVVSSTVSDHVASFSSKNQPSETLSSVCSISFCVSSFPRCFLNN